MQYGESPLLRERRAAVLLMLSNQRRHGGDGDLLQASVFKLRYANDCLDELARFPVVPNDYRSATVARNPIDDIDLGFWPKVFGANLGRRFTGAARRRGDNACCYAPEWRVR